MSAGLIPEHYLSDAVQVGASNETMGPTNNQITLFGTLTGKRGIHTQGPKTHNDFRHSLIDQSECPVWMIYFNLGVKILAEVATNSTWCQPVDIKPALIPNFG